MFAHALGFYYTIITSAAECDLEVLPHPVYSTDVAPGDIYLFAKMKSAYVGDQKELFDGQWRHYAEKSFEGHYLVCSIAGETFIDIVFAFSLENQDLITENV